HPDELVAGAAQLGYAALAVTDRNSLAGVVRAHMAAKAAGLPLLVGAEITPADAPAVLLYAPDRAAYGRLARPITRGRRSAPRGECCLSFDDVAEHADGLLAVVVMPPVPTPDDLQHLSRYRAAFRDRGHLAISLHRGPDDAKVFARLESLARQAR